MENSSIPPRTCRICLVRHGETAWNAERRLQGHLDIPLNETGLAQAEATATRLQALGHGFAALYCSDLLRARQTAAAIAHRQALETIQDERLRERHYGLFQGLTYDEAERQHPGFYQRFKARELDFGIPEHGESLLAFSARVGAVLNDIATRHAGQTVLVVTHGGVLDISRRLACGTALHTPRDFPIPNAGLNWIEHSAGNWQLLAWADESHLGGALDELPSA